MSSKYRKSDLLGYVWMMPAFVLICIFSVYPALSALFHSFTEWDLVSSKFIWFDNFTRLFADKIFWKSCVNLIILLVTGMIFGNIAPLCLAELLHNLRSTRASNVYRFLFILPALVPGMVNMLIWTKIVFSPFSSGLVNSFLENFGVEAQSWYFEEDTALLSGLCSVEWRFKEGKSQKDRYGCFLLCSLFLRNLFYELFHRAERCGKY